MCEPVSIGLAAVALIGGTMAAKDGAKARGQATDAQRKTHMEQVREMNMANANLNLDLKDKHEAAREHLVEVNLQALRNESTVRAAMGESMLSGRSMKAINNEVANQASKERVMTAQNYQRDYQSIFANQITNTENTKSSIRGSGRIFQPNKLGTALGIVGSTASAAASGYKGKSGGDAPAPKGGAAT